MVKLLAFLLVALPYGCGGGSGASQAPARTQTVAQQAQSTIQNDPKVVIHHCGAPDRNTENDFFQEGSTVSIQSRTLTYSKAHLSMIYVSSGQDQWAFSGLVDTQTNHALSTDEAQRTLKERMPCAISQPAATDDAGSSTPETKARNRKSEAKNQATEGRRG
ncbi:MAG TPA: hypothetical protein VJS11_00315 [Acidobacteriaceae bacterium]|nr:hypothetical protein [Acidobacteriaceae bacterium]